jgi:uncharacterized protein (DUF488 family)
MKAIHTIGTQGMDEKRFLSLLDRQAVDALLDVRLRTEGYRYRFASGGNIKRLVEDRGIPYIHDTVFAPTAEMLNAWRTDFDWPEYAKKYRALMEHRDMAGRLRESLRSYAVPCLLCAEHHPLYCHRRLLGELAGKVFKTEVIHL